MGVQKSRLEVLKRVFLVEPKEVHHLETEVLHLEVLTKAVDVQAKFALEVLKKVFPQTLHRTPLDLRFRFAF